MESMNFGVAVSGVCGIAAVGVLQALEKMGMKPEALYINDNSILPVYLNASGMERDKIIGLCKRAGSFTVNRKRALQSVTSEIERWRPKVKLYLSAKSCAYTTHKEFFSKAHNLFDVRAAVSEMAGWYRNSEALMLKQPQTWPLTSMGCERIFLISPYCCKLENKCDLHLRLPAYDRGAVEDLQVSFYQGYRAVEHIEKQIYDKLLF